MSTPKSFAKALALYAIMSCAHSAELASYRVYVTNEMSGDLTVIDGPSLRVIATVPLGKRPRGIQLSPDGKRLYVALSGSPIAGPGDASRGAVADKTADGIGILDVRSLKVLRRLRGVSDPEQFAITPDGRQLFAASEDTGAAAAFALATGKITANFKVGLEPEGVRISPDGRFVNVTSEAENLVAVISTVTNRVAKRFEVGKRPRAIAFTHDGLKAYVSCELDNSITVVDAKAHAVLATIALGDANLRPMGIALSQDERILYVATGRGQRVIALDTHSFATVKTVTVGARPWGIAVSPDGRRLFTANGPSNDVTVVDTTSFRVVATIAAGARPWGVAIGTLH